MKITKKNKIFFSLIGASALLTPLAIVSCSSSNSKTKVDQKYIDQKYLDFQNSLILDNIIGNLYFENFFVDTETTATISLDEATKIFALNNFEPDGLNYEFVVSKTESKIELSFELKISENDKQLLPSNLAHKTRIISDVRTLESNVAKAVSDLKTNFSTEAKKFKAFKKIILDDGTVTEQKLVTPGNVLPSYLNETYFVKNIGEWKTSVSTLLSTIGPDFDFEFSFEFDNIRGKISISLIIINKKTSLITKNPEKVEMEDQFAKQEDRTKELGPIFDKQLGQNYTLDSKQIEATPIFASSLYNEEEVTIFLRKINNGSDGYKIQNFKLPDGLQTGSNKWYTLSINVSANDTIGGLTIEYIMKDKFTGTLIELPNYSSISYISGFTSLVEGTDKKDLSKLNNVFEMYKFFETIELKAKFRTLPSENTDWKINQIEWLLKDSNTTMRTLLNNNKNIELSTNGEDFEITTNSTTTIFKAESISNTPASDKEIIKNDIMGVIGLPFVLKMKIGNSFCTILPPESKSGEGENLSFSSKAANKKFIQIGGYRTTHIDNISKIYTEVKNTEEIIVDKKLFNQLSAIQTQKLLMENFKEEVDEFFIKTLKLAGLDDSAVLAFKNAFTYKLDFLEQPPITTVVGTAITAIATSAIEFKIVSKNNSNDIQKWIDTNGTPTAFPTVTFVIKPTP